MDADTVIGCFIVACALIFITYLTLWSRKTIDWIDAKGQRSAREIMKELDGDR